MRVINLVCVSSIIASFVTSHDSFAQDEMKEVLIQKFSFDWTREDSRDALPRPTDLPFTISDELLNKLREDIGAKSGMSVGRSSVIFKVSDYDWRRRTGEVHGYFGSPNGYKICTAAWLDQFINCNNTFNASYLPEMKGIPDGGLGFYMNARIPRELGIFKGSCFIRGSFELTFVKSELRDQFKCKPYGMCSWLEGPNAKGRDVPSCVRTNKSAPYVFQMLRQAHARPNAKGE